MSQTKKHISKTSHRGTQICTPRTNIQTYKTNIHIHLNQIMYTFVTKQYTCRVKRTNTRKEVCTFSIQFSMVNHNFRLNIYYIG